MSKVLSSLNPCGGWSKPKDLNAVLDALADRDHCCCEIVGDEVCDCDCVCDKMGSSSWSVESK